VATIVPRDISVNKQAGELTIEWTDGHLSVYPLSLVREACPCASCRGGHEAMRDTPDPQVFLRPRVVSAATRLQQVEPVGAYALNFIWEDGHRFGIYTWSYLRALCPCPICRQEAAYGG